MLNWAQRLKGTAAVGIFRFNRYVPSTESLYHPATLRRSCAVG
jgi:hypothetical protein